MMELADSSVEASGWSESRFEGETSALLVRAESEFVSARAKEETSAGSSLCGGDFGEPPHRRRGFSGSIIGYSNERDVGGVRGARWRRRWCHGSAG